MSKYKIKIAAEATHEIQNAVDYYNDQKRGLGKIFFSELNAQLKLIAQNPFTKSVRYDDVRFALTKKFPYAIHYTINESEKCINIHAILSDYQDPESNWQKRSI